MVRARGGVLRHGHGDEDLAAGVRVEAIDPFRCCTSRVGCRERATVCLANPGHHGRRSAAAEAVVLCSHRRALDAATRRDIGAAAGRRARRAGGCHHRAASRKRRPASLSWPGWRGTRRRPVACPTAASAHRARRIPEIRPNRGAPASPPCRVARSLPLARRRTGRRGRRSARRWSAPPANPRSCTSCASRAASAAPAANGSPSASLMCPPSVCGSARLPRIPPRRPAAPIGWPPPHSRRSVRCPSSRPPREVAEAGVARLQAVLVGAGQRLHVAVGGVDVRPPVLAGETLGRRSPAAACRRTGGTSGNRSASTAAGHSVATSRSRNVRARVRTASCSPLDVGRAVPGLRRVRGRCRSRRSSGAGPSRASPRPAGDATWTPRCRRA